MLNCGSDILVIQGQRTRVVGDKGNVGWWPGLVPSPCEAEPFGVAFMTELSLRPTVLPLLRSFMDVFVPLQRVSHDSRNATSPVGTARLVRPQPQSTLSRSS